MTLLRSLFCLIPLVFFIKKPKNISYLTLAAYGILFGIGMNGGLNLAMHQGLSAGMSSVLLQFSAFFTMLLCYLFLKEAITKPHVIGMIFSSAGLFIILSVTAEGSSTESILLILVAAFCWSLCNLIVKIKKPDDMIAFIVWSGLFSTPPLLIFTLITEGTQSFQSLYSHTTWNVVFSILFQCFVTTICGYMIWNNLLKKYPASAIAPLSLIVPIAGILISYIFLNEELSLIQMTATTCILIGVAILVNSNNVSKCLNKPKQQRMAKL